METLICHALLPHTVQFAKRCNRFYARLYREIDVSGIRTVSDLLTLPAVSKTELSAADDLLSLGADPISVYNSSGTTGAFTVFYRTADEQNFNYDFRLAFERELSLANDDESLTLRLYAPSHGEVLRLPRQGPGVLHCVVDAITAANVASLLQRRFAFPGRPYITSISGGTRQIYWLTAYLLHRGIDPAGLHVRKLALGGDYVPHQARRYLERKWQARIELTWSQSELLGTGQLIDASKDWYRLEHTFVAEIVDPFNPAARMSEGALLATTLYPFVQSQPLIRYRTGDAFEYDPLTRMHRFLGRERQCLFVDRGDEGALLAISGTSVQEAVTMSPFTHRMRSIPLPDVELPLEISQPVFDCHYGDASDGVRSASIIVEVQPGDEHSSDSLCREAERLLLFLSSLNPYLRLCQSAYGLDVQWIFVAHGSLSAGANAGLGFGKVRGFWDADLDLRALEPSIVARATLRSVGQQA
jgi:phenylacetate-coenzyme A ligase PaaK-like adenylate-forming protein